MYTVPSGQQYSLARQGRPLFALSLGDGKRNFFADFYWYPNIPEIVIDEFVYCVQDVLSDDMHSIPECWYSQPDGLTVEGRRYRLSLANMSEGRIKGASDDGWVVEGYRLDHD